VAFGALYPSNMDDNTPATEQQQTQELSGRQLTSLQLFDYDDPNDDAANQH
jgi:hypothetical protein